MYKYLIIGVTLIILYGSGYYIWRSGGGELIRNAYATDVTTNLNPPTTETISGIYSCDIKTGCSHKYTLFLKEDMTVELLSSLVHEKVDTKEIYAEEEVAQTIERNSIIVNSSDSAVVTNNESSASLEEVASSSLISIDTTNATTTAVEFATTTENIPKEQPSKPIESLADIVNDQPLGNIVKGSWGLGHNNILIITLTEQGTTTFEIPQKLIIKKIESSVLSRIDFNKTDYKDMIKPAFVREN